MTGKNVKLTRDFCLAHQNILFHPETPDEAARIQEGLFALGFRWIDGLTTVRFTDELIHQTLILNYPGHPGISRHLQGRIYNGMLCDIKQLDPDYMGPEEKMRAEFNALCAKVDRLTVLVEKLCDELLPDRSIDKPALKDPSRGNAP